MALVRCSCLSELAPVPDDPHQRRLIVLVADPECGYVLHRIQLPEHVDNGEELATFAEHALTELKADPEWTARIARLGELEARIECPGRLALCGVPCGCEGKNPSHYPAEARPDSNELESP